MSRARLYGGVIGILLLVVTGCGEDIASTRIPAGAVHNFFYHLQHGELADAMAYWAPDYTPADARTRTSAAVARLQGYEMMVTKTDSTRNADKSWDIAVRGRARAPGSSWSDEQELLQAHVIERGPGWRLTDFTLVCCAP